MAKWNDGNSTPNERGWYLRDYRNSGCHDCPPFSVDLFEPDPDRYSILYPASPGLPAGRGLKLRPPHA